jgi:hypothetical protein
LESVCAVKVPGVRIPSSPQKEIYQF